MKEEEKKAIEYIERQRRGIPPNGRFIINNTDINTVLNLIETQKAEIDLMAKHIATTDSQLCEYIDTKYKKRECKPENINDCAKCIIEYFRKLAEEEK